MAETVHLTMTRQQLLDVRAKAANRERPASHSFGQRIIGYHEFTTSSTGPLSRWHASVVLTDGAPVEIDKSVESDEVGRE